MELYALHDPATGNVLAECTTAENAAREAAWREIATPVIRHVSREPAHGFGIGRPMRYVAPWPKAKTEEFRERYIGNHPIKALADYFDTSDTALWFRAKRMGIAGRHNWPDCNSKRLPKPKLFTPAFVSGKGRVERAVELLSAFAEFVAVERDWIYKEALSKRGLVALARRCLVDAPPSERAMRVPRWIFRAEQQNQCLSLRRQGASVEEIAQRLDLSTGQVAAYIRTTGARAADFRPPSQAALRVPTWLLHAEQQNECFSLFRAQRPLEDISNCLGIPRTRVLSYLRVTGVRMIEERRDRRREAIQREREERRLAILALQGRRREDCSALYAEGREIQDISSVLNLSQRRVVAYLRDTGVTAYQSEGSAHGRWTSREEELMNFLQDEGVSLHEAGENYQRTEGAIRERLVRTAKSLSTRSRMGQFIRPGRRTIRRTLATPSKPDHGE